MEVYSHRYFDYQQTGSLRSAQAVVPIVLDMIRPSSVVDVGCGVGTWLSVFRDNGVRDVVGIDGEYVDRSSLHIPPETFLPRDLERPIVLKRTFDLALSLEVAEHLNPAVSAQFITSLTSLAPVVLFSAAIPFQMGTHHVNERWPDYWADIFASVGYYPITTLREKMWDNEDVEVWYRQNMLLYIRKDLLDSKKYDISFQDVVPRGNLSVVHPELFLAAADPTTLSLSRFVVLMQAVPYVFVKLIRRLWK